MGAGAAKSITIPAVMISTTDGLALKSLTSAAGGTRVHVPEKLPTDPYAWSYINLADFSSKGPVIGDLRIKPDIVCPVCCCVCMHINGIYLEYVLYIINLADFSSKGYYRRFAY
jgi:hypothetical protein